MRCRRGMRRPRRCRGTARRGANGKTLTVAPAPAIRSISSPALESAPITATRLPAGSKFAAGIAACMASPRKSLRPTRSGTRGTNGDSQATTTRPRQESPSSAVSDQVSVSSSNTELTTSRSKIMKSWMPAASNSLAASGSPTRTTLWMRSVTGTWCASSRGARSGPSTRPRKETRRAARTPPPAPLYGAGCCGRSCGPPGS